MYLEWSSFYTPYTEQEVKKYVPIDSGIYLLWVQLKNEKWRCSYVGQADDLEDRLLNHLSKFEENECIKTKASKYVCGFEYAKVSRESDREGIENFLY